MRDITRCSASNDDDRGMMIGKAEDTRRERDNDNYMVHTQ